MMIRPRWMQVLGSLTIATALVACTTSTPESDKDDVEEALQKDDATLKQAPNADPDANPDAADKHGKRERPNFAGMGRGGPIQVLRQALDGMDLTADQKTAIDKAFADAKPSRDGKPEGKPEGMQAFFDEVAGQIRANHIDKAGLLAKASDLEKPAVDPMRASMAKTLQTVHDTLTAEQRVKLANELSDKLDAMGGHLDKLGKRDGKRDGKRGGGAGFLLRGIDVSDEQEASIEKALTAAGLDKSDEMKKGGEEMTAKMKALLEAFKGDKFDAAAMLPAAPEMKGNHLETMIKSLEIVVPLLDEAQRNELADRIQKGMDGGKHGPRGDKKRGGPNRQD